MFAKDRLNVIFESDLCWFFGEDCMAAEQPSSDGPSSDGRCRNSREVGSIEFHRCHRNYDLVEQQVVLVIKNELATVQDSPEHVVHPLVGIRGFTDQLHQPSSLRLGYFA